MKKLVKESLEEFLFEDKVFKGQVDVGLDIEDVDKKEFLVGMAVEKKHSNSLEVRKTLVLQNLHKNPKFYSEGMKKGLYDDPEAINIYKKYFIDKEEAEEENLKESLENDIMLKDELILEIINKVYRNEKDPKKIEKIKKELELLSLDELEDKLLQYYLFEIPKNKNI